MSFPPTACPADGLSLRDGAQQKSSLLLCGYIFFVCRTARSFCCFVFLSLFRFFVVRGEYINVGQPLKVFSRLFYPFQHLKRNSICVLSTYYFLLLLPTKTKIFFSVKTYFLHLNLHSAKGQFFKSEYIFSL